MKQEKGGRIKALIFDVGGVLRLGHPSFNHPNVHSFVARELKTNLDQYLDSIDTPYAKSIEGKISEEKALRIMARNLKTTPKKLRKLYLKTYKKYYTLNKELLEFAFKKKKQGYKIAILSDQWYLSKKALFSRDFYDKFDAVIISCDVGLRKPNPKIYRLTLKKLKVKPKESVFIDNQKWNLVPARKLGMKNILFKNNKQSIKELNQILK
ncbi:MAG: HAD family phosphatase [Nanoarchaeota archaeon]|nr:HAD family phosphatase [Nanoarchaeota archaeon]